MLNCLRYLTGMLHTIYTIWFTSGVCTFTSVLQLASPSSSSESRPVGTEIYQLGRKVIWLHTGFAFARFYFQCEGAEWPSASPVKCTARHRGARSTGKRAQKTLHCMETPHFHTLCIAELLRCFCYSGSCFCWISFIEASCLALQSVNRSWRRCERRLPIRNCHLVKNDPSVCSQMRAQQQKSNLFSVTSPFHKHKHLGKSF